ncbi:hypothetical protein T4D_8890 [Trichinella pseudospiralis]|uniref:Uncharacterized protein n=1 Tax=Trichinella pseudospiralis TaxID=6337 RepID=A0A0V1FXI2_TRIPS|nr:hypothetical protein T4D_8890 [Trichinella pseudospiralis]
MRFTWLTSLTSKSQEVNVIIIEAAMQKSTERGKSQEKVTLYRLPNTTVVAVVVRVVVRKRQKLRVGVSQHTSDCPFFDYNSRHAHPLWMLVLRRLGGAPVLCRSFGRG